MKILYFLMMFFVYMFSAILLRKMEVYFHFRINDFLWACGSALLALPFIFIGEKYMLRRDRS